MTGKFFGTKIEDFVDEINENEQLSDDFKTGNGRWKSSDTIHDVLHLLTKEELLKHSLEQFEIDIFLQCLEKKRREFSSGKIFNDPIHGHMEIHPACVMIIDTPQFQRLRYIKQLGMCYFVFPGASHNRFEHSIGTCYLAGQFCRSLRENQPELGITDNDILCVEIAGLCHDLGQGPFSRLFVDRFLPSFSKRNQEGSPEREYARKHKVPSAKMFDNLLDEKVDYIKLKTPMLKAEIQKVLKEIYGIEERDITFIREQIDGPPVTGSTAWPYKGREEYKAYLYEIVSNLRNGIDVCKWDYLARDCHHLGMRNNFDHRRYMKFARVIEESGEHQICLRDKEAGNVYNMFYSRYTLNKYVYKHPANCAIEEMVVDVLRKADQDFRVTEALTNAHKRMESVKRSVEEALGKESTQAKEAQDEIDSAIKTVNEALTNAHKQMESAKRRAQDETVSAIIKVNEALTNAHKQMESAKRSVEEALGKESTQAKEVNNILSYAESQLDKAKQVLVDILDQDISKLLPMSKIRLPMSKRHDPMKHLFKLTDDVLYKIRLDKDSVWQASKDILTRLYKRQIYRCVIKSEPLAISKLKKNPTVDQIEQKIIKLGEKNNPPLDLIDKFFVQIVHLDFGMKDENPVSRLRVYRKDDLHEARHLPDDEISRILRPPHFDEQEIRVYSKDTDQSFNSKLRNEAENYLKCLDAQIKKEEEDSKK